MVVDIGSRLGNNLIVAALFTKARELIGIEMNEYFANLSQRIVQQDCKLLMFQPPCKCNIRIVHDDVRNQTDTLERADIVIFFNPFEQHFERDTHRELLQFMRQHVCRSGVRLITVPSMAEIYGRAEMTSAIDVDKWLIDVGSTDDVFCYDVR